MMRGTVWRREATLEVTITGSLGCSITVEAVIDTGFTGYVTLPQAAIHALRLSGPVSMEAMLADGQVIDLQLYTAAITWHGTERVVEIIATGTEPLIGMSLLEGSDVRLQVRDGGQVTIRPLRVSP